LVLNQIKRSLQPALDQIGSSIGKVGITPNMLTGLGFALAILAGFLFAYRPAEQYLAGLSIIASGLMDVFDGAVARSFRRVSKSGSFTDSTLDRISEIAIFAGIMYANYSRLSPEIVLLTLGFSILVSYIRAKGDSLGVTLSGIGLGERAERLVILIIFSLAGYVWLGVYLILFLAIVTVIQRYFYLLSALRKKGKSSPPD
jgi:archaetidylinositol phosphate synthase